MTDQLEADVERWLAEEVRTTWPGKSGDCCDTDERADMARWFAGQIRAFSHWLAQATPYTKSYGRLPNVVRIDGYGAVRPQETTEPPNSTPADREMQ